jgi:hypothetical protein
MEPIYIFTLTGAFAMGAALHARQVSHDVLTQNQQALDTTDDKESAPQTSVPGIYLAAGNLAVIALIASIVYGGQNFAWWIPVSFLVVSFPAIYYIFLRRMLKPKLGSLVYTFFALIGLVPMVQGWMV